MRGEYWQGVYCHEGFIVVVRYERRDEEQTVSIYSIPAELNGCCGVVPIKNGGIVKSNTSEVLIIEYWSCHEVFYRVSRSNTSECWG